MRGERYNLVELYKYFLFIDGSAKDFRYAVDFHYKYRSRKGKFLCLHDWELFEVVKSGALSTIIPVRRLCLKCGKVGAGNVKIDGRLVDYSGGRIYYA